MNTTTVTTPNELEIRVERIFDAPRAHVFSVWTDPKLIPEWWGDGTVVEEMDVRPGGTYRFQTAYGVVEGEFREVDAPERLVTMTVDGVAVDLALTFERDDRIPHVRRLDVAPVQIGRIAAHRQIELGRESLPQRRERVIEAADRLALGAERARARDDLDQRMGQRRDQPVERHRQVRQAHRPSRQRLH